MRVGAYALDTAQQAELWSFVELPVSKVDDMACCRLRKVGILAQKEPCEEYLPVNVAQWHYLAGLLRPCYSVLSPGDSRCKVSVFGWRGCFRQRIHIIIDDMAEDESVQPGAILCSCSGETFQWIAGWGGIYYIMILTVTIAVADEKVWRSSSIIKEVLDQADFSGSRGFFVIVFA